MKNHPHLLEGGRSEQDIQNLEEACKEAWKDISEDFLNVLIESMPRRVAACISADGWHTKY